MSETKLKELIRKKQEIIEKINELEDKREKELLPIYRKQFVGRCFKYFNSGGTGDRWWLFARILDVQKVNFLNKEEPFFKVIQIEYTSQNHINIELREYSFIRAPEWIEISKEVFENEWLRIMQKADAFLKARSK